MTTEQLKELSINASNAYHKYLEETGKGLNEVDLWGMEVVDRAQRIVNLRLSKKVFDTESILLRIEGDEKDLDSTHFTVLEYDTDKGFLYLELSGPLFDRFTRLRAMQVKVIADMKFLVERVRDFFVKKGDSLQMPDKVSPLKDMSALFPFSEFLMPTPDQQAAVQTILTKPFSYVWGAPGTGKTQLVLANVIIQYVKQGKRCAILAPTNTALEQVLKGVLRMSDAAGIPRHKFLRLGHTTKWFAELYPEICEASGIQSQRLQVDRQIRVVRSLVKKEQTGTNETLAQLEGALDELIQLKDLLSVVTEKAPSQKLIKQMLKKASEGLNAHPLTRDFGEKLTVESVTPTMIFLQNFIQQQKRDEAVLQARAVEMAMLPEEELKQMLETLEQSRERMSVSNERARQATVIAATLDSYIYRFADDDLGVEHIFLDEAGYACAIKALTLFTGNVPITFLGDHLQLPPVCEMNDMDMQQEARQPVYIWSKSAIHLPRLFDQTNEQSYEAYMNNEETLSPKMARTDLCHTHRFSSKLADVLNEYVYQNGFGSNSDRGETEIYFVHAETPVPQPRNAYQKPTRESEQEAALIRQFVQTNGLTDYVIITPYINQAKLLGKAMTRERNEGRIMTVHASQGKEWDNVLLSVVDTDKKWFTDTRSQKSRGLFLINTAVSRAKRRLIIFCNADYWKRQNGQLLKGLITAADPLPLL